MTQSHVSLEKQLTETDRRQFHFRANSAEEGIDRLDALVDAGVTDYDKLRDELKEYIISPRKRTSTKQKDDKVSTETKTKKKTSTKKTKNVVAESKTKRARGDNNEKRQKALAMFADLLKEGTLNTENIIKRVQTELGITYANTYYYWSRVFNKGQKPSETVTQAETAPVEQTEVVESVNA